MAGDDRTAVESAVRGAMDTPLRVYATDDLDPTGALVESLGAREGEVWVLRPDAYVAAVLPAGTDDVLRAARRAIGPAAG